MTVATAVEWGMCGSWTTKLGGKVVKGKGIVGASLDVWSGGVVEGGTMEVAREGDGSGVVMTNVLGTQLKGTYEAGSCEVGRLGTIEPFASTNRVLPVV